jgi:hypothetical protein
MATAAANPKRLRKRSRIASWIKNPTTPQERRMIYALYPERLMAVPVRF